MGQTTIVLQALDIRIYASALQVCSHAIALSGLKGRNIAITMPEDYVELISYVGTWQIKVLFALSVSLNKMMELLVYSIIILQCLSMR